MSACYLEWTVNSITTYTGWETTDDHNSTDTFSLPELITTGQGDGTLATTAPDNCNHQEDENTTVNKEEAKGVTEEITVNALCDDDVDWQIKDKLMMDSGAGVCVCPLAYAEDCPLLPVSEEEKPPLRNVSGGRVTVYGKREVKYLLSPTIILTVLFWVCQVHAPLLSVDALCKKGLTTTFTGTDSWLYKDYHSEEWVKLFKQGPLWFVPTLGRVKSRPPKPLSTEDEVTKRLEEKMKAMSRYLAVVSELPKPPNTSWSDYWVVRKDCTVRAHRSARRRLYFPDHASPVPLDDLSGERIAARKSYPDNVVTKVSDN